jgi:hypothetical protein
MVTTEERRAQMNTKQTKNDWAKVAERSCARAHNTTQNITKGIDTNLLARAQAKSTEKEKSPEE